MLKRIVLLLILSLIPINVFLEKHPAYAASETPCEQVKTDRFGYYRQPTVSGNTIYFVCEDDLWSVPISGGVARRLTAGKALISLPRVSPDGKTLAFVGREEGHSEVYVMPSDGGEARRLTFLGSGFCMVSGFSPDGKQIYFVSDSGVPFGRAPQFFTIPVNGGMPQPLDIGHGTCISVNEKGQTVIGRNAYDPARWKRYHGGTAGELWIDKDGNGQFVPLIKLNGNMVMPMWVGDRVFFLSDHEGIGNIYSCLPDGSDLKRHTNHVEYYVRFPSTDGKHIVYTAGAQLYLLDPDSDTTTRLSVEAPTNMTQSERKFVQGIKSLQYFAPDPKGDSLLAIVRGQPAIMPFWEGAVVQHGAGSQNRYRFCEWLPDGKRFVVVSNSDGFDKVELHYTDLSKAPQTVSDENIGRFVEIAVSPKNDQVAIATNRQDLILLDLKTHKTKVLDHSPADMISGLAWSPDGRYVAYSWPQAINLAIIRCADSTTSKVHDVTDAIRSDSSPCFDPEGKYLYFLSTRDYFPVVDQAQFDLSFPVAQRPFLVTLRKDMLSPFVPQPKPFVKDADKDEKNKGEDKEVQAASSKSKKKGKDGKAKGKKEVAVNIDFDGITQRIQSFPVEDGLYSQLVAAKGRVLYVKLPLKPIEPNTSWMEKDEPTGALLAYDFDDQKTSTIEKNVSEIRLAQDNRTLLTKLKKSLRAVDAMKKESEGGEEKNPSTEENRKTGYININRIKVMVEPTKEWSQMLDEAWQLQKEYFWSNTMSNVDWDLVHSRYRALLPYVRTRSDLSDLIWEMQGELGTSHAYEFLGDYRTSPHYPRGFLGADLAFDEKTGGYKIVKIIRGDSWDAAVDSPLAEPGLNIKEGDAIVAVGGKPVSKELSVDALLVDQDGDRVSLTILPQETKVDANKQVLTRKSHTVKSEQPKDEAKTNNKREVVVKTLKDEYRLRYRAWVEANRRYVHDKTDGKVGYVHIPDMGPWGFSEFHRGFLSEYTHPSLIVDVRYNGGGNVSPLLLEKLVRKRVGYGVTRWGQPTPYPYESVGGPLVAITNQFAGSDGDIFSHAFKLMKLGPLVGKRTWGGVIGISGRERLVDGTLTTQPEFSFWFKDVGWGVENHGTNPDYEVDIAPQDYKANRDPQLDKAIDLAQQALKTTPFEMPAFDKRPDLSIPKSLTESHPAGGM